MILRLYKNVSIGSGFRAKGIPLLNAWDGGEIVIGNNVQLNSRNRGYHVSMYSPVKLFAESNNTLIRIGDRTRIHGSCIHAIKRIEIGKNCLIAANCQIMDSSGHELCLENPEDRINSKGKGKAIFIHDNVWLGTGCIIMPGVTIGAGTVVSANSVVIRDLPPGVVAAGNPARVIKEIVHV
ncbi:acyltransferase [Reinekea marina]|uniref:acyltransferase n=1 Tax=Reinekea marina TaxID=1310421 RepID=UPI0025B5535C|nr:acyltransferase [Reinekea marina]MDN3648160.1 acyltransferase [Reinekea marina]